MSQISSSAVHKPTANQNDKVVKVVFAGIFAALTYVVFTFLSIPIPTPGGQVSVHLGNAFVVLGALLLGGAYGGVGGALGLTIADLFVPAYLPEAPITFVIKLLLGLIVGLAAHKIGHITTETDTKKVQLWDLFSRTGRTGPSMRSLIRCCAIFIRFLF